MATCATIQNEYFLTTQLAKCLCVCVAKFMRLNTDFGKFIKNVLNHHEAMIANPNVDSGCKEQLKDVIDVYKVLEKNYNQVLSKTKYA